MAITEFRGRWQFLSNYFYPMDVRIKMPSRIGVEIPLVKLPTVEHAYQAAKVDGTYRGFFDATGYEAHEYIKLSPGQAKRLGQNVPLRHDWPLVRVGVMDSFLRQKFAPGTRCAKFLAETGWGSPLIEGNTWHDNFWGSCHCRRCGNRGDNELGKLLMAIREELMRGKKE